MESKEEAQYLYHCLNLNYGLVKVHKGNYVPFPEDSSIAVEMWADFKDCRAYLK